MLAAISPVRPPHRIDLNRTMSRALHYTLVHSEKSRSLPFVAATDTEARTKLAEHFRKSQGIRVTQITSQFLRDNDYLRFVRDHDGHVLIDASLH